MSKGSFSISETGKNAQRGFMEKHIRMSTQGRLTIPKQIRDAMRIRDGQPFVIKTDSFKREIILELQPTIADFK
ncbi:MAG: hypothetical protein JRN67_03300 [Nitrososphaerota archaeon]|nr:hypothetical protein [Nitrososphaerota archaeon]